MNVCNYDGSVWLTERECDKETEESTETCINEMFSFIFVEDIIEADCGKE